VHPGSLSTQHEIGLALDRSGMTTRRNARQRVHHAFSGILVVDPSVTASNSRESAPGPGRRIVRGWVCTRAATRFRRRH